MKKIILKLIKKTGFTKLYARLSGVDFGNNCKFSNKVDFGSEPYLVTLGNDFYCSANITFITHDGSVNVLRNIYKECEDVDFFGRVIIGNNVFLGFNVTLLPGAKIGDNVIVGAHSLVKGKLSSNSVYAGSPAKYICSIDDYKNKNESQFVKTKLMKSVDKEREIKKIWKKNEHI
jgi:acetyltransferase-like isoleucine patch superfamily enzyme